MSGLVRSLRPSWRWKGGVEVGGQPEIGVCRQGTGSWAGRPHPELNFQEKRVLLKGGGRESSWGRGAGGLPPSQSSLLSSCGVVLLR